MKKPINKERVIKVVLLLYLVFMCVFLAIRAGFETAPDEGMKFELINYIAKHLRLPSGSNPAIINKMWGTSYAFNPYISYIFSAVLVRITMLFTNSLKALVFSARLISVIFISLYYVVVFKIAKSLFKGIYKYLFVVLVIFIPLTIYLGSYINLDAFSLFCVSLIFLSWIRGIETNWSYKSCILLGIGIGLCFLSYYFVYGYILCSFLFFVISHIIRKIDFKSFFKKGMIVFLIALTLSGWWFVRQYQLYDGDVIALSYSTKIAEEYADEMHKPSYLTKHARSVFMFPTWLFDSLFTFIAVFRYNDIFIHYLLYYGYYFVILLSLLELLILFVFKFSKRKNSKQIVNDNYLLKFYNTKEKVLFYSILLLVSIIPIILSAYYSYNIDYQPQGRYFLSISIPLMTFVVLGYSFFLDKTKRFKKIYLSIVFLYWLLVPVYIYFTYLSGHIETKISHLIR